MILLVVEGRRDLAMGKKGDSAGRSTFEGGISPPGANLVPYGSQVKTSHHEDDVSHYKVFELHDTSGTSAERLVERVRGIGVSLIYLSYR